MPIGNMFPQFTQPGEEFAKAGTDFSAIRAKMIEAQQNAQKIQQEGLANEQKNNYQMGELGISQQELPSKIALQKAQAKYYDTGGGLGGRGRGGVNLQNQMQLMQQAIIDNPGIDMARANQITSAWLDGSPTLADGSPTPEMSGNSRQILLNIQGKNAPVAVKNQAANYDVLYNNLNDFDIDAVKSFAGPKGVAKLATAKAMMATNPDDPNIDPVARRYISAINQSIINMDEMRKAFGTSVVPDYVYSTIGRLANPNDSIWNDPTQVEKTYKDMVKVIKKNRDAYFEKAKHGVTAQLKNTPEEKPAQGASTSPQAPQAPEKKREKWGKDANGKAILMSK